MRYPTSWASQHCSVTRLQVMVVSNDSFSWIVDLGSLSYHTVSGRHSNSVDYGARRQHFPRC